MSIRACQSMASSKESIQPVKVSLQSQIHHQHLVNLVRPCDLEASARLRIGCSVLKSDSTGWCSLFTCVVASFVSSVRLQTPRPPGHQNTSTNGNPLRSQAFWNGAHQWHGSWAKSFGRSCVQNHLAQLPHL